MKVSYPIDMKMPAIDGIFIYTSTENFMLSRVKHEKFYNLRVRYGIQHLSTQY